jgi:hypothetical protein
VGTAGLVASFIQEKPMEITITHCRYAPKWESLEKVIREATNEPEGRLVKIDRADGRCDYSKPGLYHLRFEQSNQTLLPIRLEIVAVGQKPESDTDRRIAFVKENPELAEQINIARKNMS